MTFEIAKCIVHLWCFTIQTTVTIVIASFDKESRI